MPVEKGPNCVSREVKRLIKKYDQKQALAIAYKLCKEIQRKELEARLIKKSIELAKLTTKKRKDLPKEDFVFPEERRYPIHDRAHAINALARVAQHGTPEEKKKVRAAVCRKYPDLPACGEKE